jgi:hypothetical protein
MRVVPLSYTFHIGHKKASTEFGGSFLAILLLSVFGKVTKLSPALLLHPWFTFDKGDIVGIVEGGIIR